MLDVTNGHPARVRTDDHRVQAVHALLALAHQAGRERAGAVPGHLDLERADLGIEHLGGGAVAGIASGDGGGLTLLIAQVAAHPGLQARLERLLEQARQEPVRAGDVHRPVRDLREQVVQGAGLPQLASHVSARPANSLHALPRSVRTCY